MANTTSRRKTERRAGATAVSIAATTTGTVAGAALVATALAGPAHTAPVGPADTPASVAPAGLATGGAATADWRQVHGAPEDGGSFTAVAAAGPDAVWAFGDDSAQGRGATWIHRWDGDGWTREPVPDGWTVEPNTADAAADDAVWAAGTSSDGEAEVLHYDGDAWSAAEIDPALRPTDVEAVDGDAVWMLSRPVDGWNRAAFFDGETWRDYPAPSVYRALSAAGPDDVFAVGHRDGRPGVDRWDGERWRPMDVPEVELPPGESDAVFTDVLARASDDVVAVGRVFWKDGADENHRRPLLARFDGDTWTVETGEEPGVYAGVAGDGDGGLWVADSAWNPTMVHIAADGTTTEQPLSDDKYDLSMGAVEAVPGGGAVVAGTAFEAGDPDVFTDYGFVYANGTWS